MILLDFIKSHENWEELLTKDPYNIKISRDDEYIMFKYNQLSSDFTNPIVRECRGIIFREADWTCVCHAFDKFMNAEEENSDLAKIDWKTASCQEKVDGCFSANDSVILEDGSKLRISSIVNNKLSCKVLSYNFNTHKIEPKKVIGWSRKLNGVGGVKQNEWLTVKLRGIKQDLNSSKKSQHSILTVTKNHLVYVKDPLNDSNIIEKSAGSLTLNDIVLTPTLTLSQLEKQVCYGTLLGDGSLTYSHDKYRSSGLTFGHSLKQEEYVRWKASLLNAFNPHIQIKTNRNAYGGNFIRVNTNISTQFSNIKNKCYLDGKKNVTREWLEQLDWFGFAIWYMDDGYLNKSAKNNSVGLATEGFSKEEVQIISDYYLDHGLKSYIKHYRNLYGLTFSTEASEYIWQQIRQFIPEFMQYKLPDRHKGYYNTDILKSYSTNKEYELIPAYIIEINEGMNRKIETTAKYDIEVEDNHNYFCGGILVHNSLMKVWHDNGWHISTNGTIDAFKAPLACVDKNLDSYGKLFLYCLKKMGITEHGFFSMLDIEDCYMFEMISPYNKVVIDYKEHKLYYLGRRNLDIDCEFSFIGDNPFENGLGCLIPTPTVYNLHTFEDIKNAANALPWDEEGYVVCDTKYAENGSFLRVKIKSPEYVLAHKLANNGVITWHRLFELILINETDEFLAYFPELIDRVDEAKNSINAFKNEVNNLIKEIDPDSFSSRKDYAKVVLTYPKKYQTFLFNYNKLDDWFAKLTASKWLELLEYK